jgi:transcriptional regulator with XRE-family HTH domain
MQGDTPGRQIDRAIGASLKELRQSRKQSARRLAEQSGISAAMISRIENGLVSPSIDTLAALAEALEVPIVSLFREARTDHTDYTLVRHGEGLKSNRISAGHSHEYVNLSLHSRKDLRFTLSAGDTISVDAELNHGFEDVLTPEFVFLTVQAERP